MAVVCGKPENTKDRLVNHLKKLKTINMSKVVDSSTHGAKEAILEYEVLDSTNHEEYGDLTLIKVELITGRHHQIRVQLEKAGLPLWGDTK